MTVDIPTNEPTELVAGDRWQWTRELSDYPASTWTLTYYFTNASANFTFAASADGDTHSVDVAIATTAAYTAGAYTWDAYISDGTTRRRVDNGRLEVLPDLATAGSVDRRSHWKIVLDNVNAVIENRATKDQQNYSINGRSLVRMPIADLLALQGKAQAEVLKEQQREDARNGRGNRSKIKVRFT